MRKLFALSVIPTLLLFMTVFTQDKQIPADDLLKFRNLQYEQAKRVVRMQDLKSEFDKLNSENEQLKAEMSAWVKDQAKKQNIDLAKFYFNSDTLKFVEIPKEKTNEK